jgi:hypothetical protein
MRTDGRKDGQTKRYEEIITFRNFALGPKNETRLLLLIGQKHVDPNGLEINCCVLHTVRQIYRKCVSILIATNFKSLLT